MVWLVYPKIQSVMGWQDSFLELIPIEIVVSLDAVVYLVMSQFLGVSRLGSVSYTHLDVYKRQPHDGEKVFRSTLVTVHTPLY